MLRIGVALLVIAFIAFAMPLLDRQFVIVSALSSTGLSLPAASGLLMLVGGALVVAGLKQSKAEPPTDGSAASSTRWLLLMAIVLCAAVVASAFLPMERSTRIAIDAPTPRVQSQEAFIAESFSFSPTPTIYVSGGKLRIVSAISPRAGEIRLKVVATPATEQSILEGSAARGMRLIKPSLCGTDGLLAARDLLATAVTLSIYEREIPIGEILLPSRFCS